LPKIEAMRVDNYNKEQLESDADKIIIRKTGQLWKQK
jgi:hypothetical protein